jgi:hypothetical protein
MVLVWPVALTRTRAIVIGMWLAIVGAGCDPTYAIVLENRSKQPILVGRHVVVRGDEDQSDVVLAPPSSRTLLGSNGVGREGLVLRIVIMDEDCVVLKDLDTPRVFTDGGTIQVDGDLVVTYTEGGNPSGGAEGARTKRCARDWARPDPDT